MKQRPILFSSEMVQAILAGRKTQTRRVVKDKCTVYNNKETCMYLEENLWKWLSETGHGSGIRYDQVFKCPYGQVGDVLWVRETFYAGGVWVRDGLTKTGKQKWKFVRDMDVEIRFEMENTLNIVRKNSYRGVGWYKRPSLYMERSMARISLRITNIRVERLQDISQQDAKAEGIEIMHGAYLRWRHYLNPDRRCIHAYTSFQTLWQSINGEQSWNDNPFVWVIEFERIEKP